CYADCRGKLDGFGDDECAHTFGPVHSESTDQNGFGANTLTSQEYSSPARKAAPILGSLFWRLKKVFLAQRRQGAKPYSVSKGFILRLCAFARKHFSTSSRPQVYLKPP